MRIIGKSSYITLSSTVGTRHGILFEGDMHIVEGQGEQGTTSYYRSRISNVTIYSFTGGGITCTGTGTAPSAHLLIVNAEIRYCNAGINIAYLSEFHRISNVVAQNCYYGCINNGGNNHFVCCDFSSNRVGILIDNSTNQSANNSHGGYSMCKTAHQYGDDGTPNKGISLKLLKANFGEEFIGVHFGSESVIIEECKGIRFSACRFGASMFTITDSKVVTFTDCGFNDNSEITQSGNDSLIFTNCFTTHTWESFDPMNT